MFVSVFAMIFGATGLGLIGFHIWLRQKAAQTAQWVSTEGMITESFVDDSDSDNITPRLAYTYQVNGQYLCGWRVSYALRGANRRAVEEIVAKYPQGKRVRVFYDTKAPASAVLENTPPGSWLLIITGFIFLAVAFYMARLS
jgi:hypothetical protein